MQQLKSYLCVVLLSLCSHLQAQYTDVINSNRPGASESAFSVGTNVLQFEAGAYSVNTEHTPLEIETKGFGLDFAVRYGLFFEQLEVQFNGVYQNDTQTFNSGAIPFEEDRANFLSLTLGAKYLVFDPYKTAEESEPNLYSYHANRRFQWKSLIPAVSVYAGANFGTPDNPYLPSDAEGVSPKIMVLTQHNFNGGWVFVMNFSQDRIGTEDPIFQYVLTLTHSITPQWVVFGETQGINSDVYGDNIFRFGGAYLWNKDFQLDTNIAFNTKDTPSVFSFALGASYRLDFHKDKKINNRNSAKEEAKRQARRQKNRS
jgi:hypothetical protein